VACAAAADVIHALSHRSIYFEQRRLIVHFRQGMEHVLRRATCIFDFSVPFAATCGKFVQHTAPTRQWHQPCCPFRVKTSQAPKGGET